MLLWIVFFGLFLLCAGISMSFLIYICVIWYASIGHQQVSNINSSTSEKVLKKGLTKAELEMIPEMDGGSLGKGKECAVCLDEIEEGETARVMPDCMHAFHRSCADAWLLVNSACPLCRRQLVPVCVPVKDIV